MTYVFKGKTVQDIVPQLEAFCRDQASRAVNASMNVKTQKEARFQEGRAAAYRALAEIFKDTFFEIVQPKVERDWIQVSEVTELEGEKS